MSLKTYIYITLILLILTGLLYNYLIQEKLKNKGEVLERLILLVSSAMMSVVGVSLFMSSMPKYDVYPYFGYLLGPLSVLIGLYMAICSLFFGIELVRKTLRYIFNFDFRKNVI